MMPLWMFTLGNELIDNDKVRIPYTNMVMSLVGLTIPLGIGLLIQRYKLEWAEKARKITRPCIIGLLIFLCFAGLYASRYVFKLFTWNMVGAGISVAWGGYIFGALAAFLAGLSRPQIIAVSIETAFQNVPIAFVLLQISLPQPDSDLAAIPVMGQMLMVSSPMINGYVIYAIVKRVLRKDNLKDDIKDNIEDVDENPEMKEMLEYV
jgi:solute carrier family 10 (sodium/bile acid cotransporter), member 3/5